MTATPLPASLAAAVADVHARLDDWASVVVGVTEESSTPTSALADPRLESAADAFDAALARYHEAMASALGLEPDAEDEDEAAEDTGLDLVADDFFVHLVIGVPDGTSERRLDAALDVVDEAATSLVDRVQAAGFTVPEWGVSRGEPDLDDLEEDE